jgi:hypothetical protein
MTHALRFLAAGLLMIAAGPAHAEDWWLVSGAPTDPTAVFADVQTLDRDDQLAQLRVLRIDRAGTSIDAVQQIECDRDAASAEQEMVRQFACASDEERDQHGLILASMSPVVVARMIFTEPIETAARGADAGT